LSRHKIEVKSYVNLPVVDIYGGDEYLYIGFFFVNGSGISKPYLKIRREGYLGKAILTHFSGIWERSESKSLFNTEKKR